MERVIALASGIELAVDDVGAGDPVVFVHGFPETKYSWRHQLPALAANGYRAVALDCRGYGGSSKPADIDAYGIEALVGDLVGLCEELDIERPVLVGHDWGSIVVWSAAVMDPDRWRAVVSLNVPYRGWSVGFPRIDYIKEHLMDRFGYVVRFQEEGGEEAVFEQDPDAWLSRIYGWLGGRPDFLDDAEFATFAASFRAGGIRGPLNYYRNIDANHDALAELENAPVELPTLVVIADGDPVLPASLVEGMERWVPDLTVAGVADAGHWVQQERPAEVNAAILAFLSTLA